MFAPDPLDDTENRFDHPRRQPERRLVEHQQPRRHHQGASDRQHLLLAAGQRAGLLSPPLCQNRKIAVHQLHFFVRPAGGGVAADPEVFLHRQADEGAAAFRHVGDAEAGNLLG